MHGVFQVDISLCSCGFGRDLYRVVIEIEVENIQRNWGVDIFTVSLHLEICLNYYVKWEIKEPAEVNLKKWKKRSSLSSKGGFHIGLKS